jgi:hypothetical protein
VLDRLARHWPFVVAAVVVSGGGIAIWQGHPDPLAAYGTLVAACTLALQFQRLAKGRPDLRMTAEVGKVGARRVLIVHANNRGGGEVTIEAIGFGRTEADPDAWQFGASGLNDVSSRFPRVLSRGGPRFEFGLTAVALAQEMRAARVTVAPHFVWIENSESAKTWRRMDDAFVADCEQALEKHAGAPKIL